MMAGFAKYSCKMLINTQKPLFLLPEKEMDTLEKD